MRNSGRSSKDPSLLQGHRSQLLKPLKLKRLTMITTLTKRITKVSHLRNVSSVFWKDEKAFTKLSVTFSVLLIKLSVFQNANINLTYCT